MRFDKLVNKNKRRSMQFFSNFIAGLFISTLIGTFFNIISGNKPVEFVADISLYSFIVIVMLIVFYKVGKLLIRKICDEKEKEGFKLNYITALLSSAFSIVFIAFRQHFIIIVILLYVGFFGGLYLYISTRRETK